MAFDRSSNPAFKEEYFQSTRAAGGAMTVQGTINKIGFLMLLVITAGSFTWKMALEGAASIQSMMYLGIFGGMITALITIFHRPMPVLLPLCMQYLKAWPLAESRPSFIWPTRELFLMPWF